VNTGTSIVSECFITLRCLTFLRLFITLVLGATTVAEVGRIIGLVKAAIDIDAVIPSLGSRDLAG
jgi:ABC-type uncharacterized transport system permease subunit